MLSVGRNSERLADPFNKFDKGFDAGSSGTLKCRGNYGVLHGRENRTLAFVAGAEKPFHGDIAEAARRNIGNAKQADVVIWVQKYFEVGQEVPDFATIEKALPTDQVITHLSLSQG